MERRRGTRPEGERRGAASTTSRWQVINDIRKALGPHKSEEYAMAVARELCQFFDKWPTTDETNLFDTCQGNQLASTSFEEL